MKKSGKIRIIIILILVLTLVLTYGVSFAKYAYNNVLNYYYKSKDFYFSSNSLDLEEVSNVNNAWDGSNTYFDIKNYLNDSLITDYDISYKVECSTNNSNYKCIINDNDSTYNGTISSSKVCFNTASDVITDINNLDDCIKNGYEWLDNKSEAKLYFNLVSLDNTKINDAEVNVTVTSTSPYKKILKGKFSLSRQLNINDDVTLNCNNYDEKVEVIVSNLLDSKKTYTLYFDSDKLRVDMTSNLKEESKDSNDFINKIAFDLDSNKNIKIVFYKTDLGKTYDKNDFKINLNN